MPDLNDLSPDEILELAYALLEEDGVEKTASGDFDLNELSVDEFLDFAEGLEEGMEKDASAGEWARKAGTAIGDAFKAKGLRRALSMRKIHSENLAAKGNPDNVKKWIEGKRSEETRNALKEGGKTLAAYGSVGAVGAGSIAAYRRRKNRR